MYFNTYSIIIILFILLIFIRHACRLHVDLFLLNFNFVLFIKKRKNCSLSHSVQCEDFFLIEKSKWKSVIPSFSFIPFRVVYQLRLYFVWVFIIFQLRSRFFVSLDTQSFSVSLSHFRLK